MVLKRFKGPRGRVVGCDHSSACLRGNALGDPHDRRVHVYLPDGYDEASDRRYPVLYDLVGFTGSGPSHVNWMSFQENLPERLDRLIAGGQMEPVLVVFPDCFTALGGNQYIDSSAIGRYASYLTEELVPFIDGRFKTLAERGHRGVFGKSSGGYGAIVHGLRYTDTWGAVACHSGDMHFDFCYRVGLPATLNELAKHGRSVSSFLEHAHGREKLSGDELNALMTIAMAASYDPDPAAPLGFHMPLDLYTGELEEQRWRRWLRHDPIRLLSEHGESLRRLSLVYVDCGSRDQYHLQYGSRIFCQRLEQLGIPHHYEEFDDDHSSVDYRMDRSLPLLAEVLGPRRV
jgi:enterochelin esterase-like enzyme